MRNLPIGMRVDPRVLVEENGGLTRVGERSRSHPGDFGLFSRIGWPGPIAEHVHRVLDRKSLALLVGVVDRQPGNLLAFPGVCPLFRMQQVQPRGTLLNLDARDLLRPFETEKVRLATVQL